MGLLPIARGAGPGQNNEGDLVDNSGAPPSPDDRGAPAGDPAEGVDDGDGASNVSPEEQAQYDKFVRNGLEVIYPKGEDAQVSPQIMQQLQGGDDPIENLANTAVHLTVAVEESAEQGGVQLDDAVVMHGGIALLEELAEVAEAAKVHDYSEDELQAATYRAMDLYREIGEQNGRVDPDALKQQFGEIVDADKRGDVQSVLPQIPKEGANG
jgi:hypothetical protein